MNTDRVNETVNGNNKISDEDDRSFYERLPRFVTDQPVEAIGADLPELTRFFEYDEKQFSLIIKPARFTTQNEDSNTFESVSRFPGDFEQKTEEALRLLADAENKNYDHEKLILVSGFTQLKDVIDWLNEDEEGVENAAVEADNEVNETNETRTEITERRIEIALSTLCAVSYILKCGGRELYFHPIERLRQVEKEGEIYYKVYFTQGFFSSSLFREFLWD